MTTARCAITSQKPGSALLHNLRSEKVCDSVVQPTASRVLGGRPILERNLLHSGYHSCDSLFWGCLLYLRWIDGLSTQGCRVPRDCPGTSQRIGYWAATDNSAHNGAHVPFQLIEYILATLPFHDPKTSSSLLLKIRITASCFGEGFAHLLGPLPWIWHLCATLSERETKIPILRAMQAQGLKDHGQIAGHSFQALGSMLAQHKWLTPSWAPGNVCLGYKRGRC